MLPTKVHIVDAVRIELAVTANTEYRVTWRRGRSLLLPTHGHH